MNEFRKDVEADPQHKKSGQGPKASFSTLHGQPEASSNNNNNNKKGNADTPVEKRQCPCGNRFHKPWKCWVVNASQRPAGYNVPAWKQSKVDEKLENDPEWKAYIEKRVTSDSSTNQSSQNAEKTRDSGASIPAGNQQQSTASATWPPNTYNEPITLYTGTSDVPVAFNAGHTDSSLASSWVFDPAAAVHVCNNRELFTEFTSCNDSLCTGDASTPIQGKGTAMLHCVDPTNNQPCTILLQNTYYSPNHHANLVSYSRTKLKGCQWDEANDCLRGWWKTNRSFDLPPRMGSLDIQPT